MAHSHRAVVDDRNAECGGPAVPFLVLPGKDVLPEQADLFEEAAFDRQVCCNCVAALGVVLLAEIEDRVVEAPPVPGA